MLCNIFFLFVCIPAINFSLTVPNDKRNAESKTTFKMLFRKKFAPLAMYPNAPLALESKKKGLLENFYEPYWEKGDWVYYRNLSTSRPQPFYLNVGNTTQHQECNQICPQFVQDYGMICAVRYNDYWARYDYRNFDDYCYMELENCFSISKNWFPVKRGNCSDGMTTQSFAHIHMITRAGVYENGTY